MSRVVYPEFFRDNPDFSNSPYQTRLGVYEEGCGLDQVHLSWGHDECFHNSVKEYLPEMWLFMLRYHSFHAGHREGACDYLTTDHDRQMFEWAKKFNPYDLCSKSLVPPDPIALRPFHEDLAAKYLPPQLNL